MNRRVRQIEEEWFVFAGAKEPDRLFGVALGQSVLSFEGNRFDHRLIAQQRQWGPPRLRRLLGRRAFVIPISAHVVGVWQAEIVVEAVSRRQELRLISQVPLADTGGRIVPLPE